MTEILDGRPVANAIEDDLRDRVARRETPPSLAVVLFGDDSPSKVYARMIERGCQRVGVSFRLLAASGETSYDGAAALLDGLNRDPGVDGIVIKRPLPGDLADERILQRTLPEKDVDGYHFGNVGRMVVDGITGAPIPCTPAGVVELLRRSGYSAEGRRVVIVGRSTTVGRPLANLLSHKAPGLDATVTLCHRATRDLASHTRVAEILITAAGVPRFVTRDMVGEGAVVIDVGTNVVDDPSAKKGYRLVGDADFDELLGHCRAITPVPGGVGPVTVAMLLKSVVDAAERRRASGSAPV